MMQIITQRLAVVWLAKCELWCKLWIQLLVGFSRLKGDVRLAVHSPQFLCTPPRQDAEVEITGRST